MKNSTTFASKAKTKVSFFSTNVFVAGDEDCLLLQ
jgi:hypothetical protein